MNHAKQERKSPCGDKLTYRDAAEAVAVRAYAAWQYGGDIRLQPYRCKACGLWHLASRFDVPDE
ncbi:MAG TPA: hypothetical protein VK963_03420 [Candidatus Saccharimonadales bacterium]|nr:hypothetical protein [Candidatus Saccharimonadales bacterium]